MAENNEDDLFEEAKQKTQSIKMKDVAMRKFLLQKFSIKKMMNLIRFWVRNRRRLK